MALVLHADPQLVHLREVLLNELYGVVDIAILLTGVGEREGRRVLGRGGEYWIGRGGEYWIGRGEGYWIGRGGGYWIGREEGYWIGRGGG